MSSVVVEVKKVTIDEINTFFQFCGEIKSINELSEGKYQVNFFNSSASDTALLLDQAELGGEKLKVSSDLPTYESSQGPDATGSTIASADDVKDHKLQGDVKTGDPKYDDIDQESKPKYVIMAQLLSKGYKINDDIIEKSITFDKKHGYSDKFKKFLNDIDIKLGAMTEDDNKAVESAISEKETEPTKFSDVAVKQFNTNVEQFKKSKYYSKFSKYFDKVSQDLDKASKDFSKNPYGVKIHAFYKNLVGDVRAVHEEALRLKEIHKEEELEGQVHDVKDTIDPK
ncbi:hypothetical protein CLIB1444_01S00540 [[Candida] jaroonii]|uniref:Uncharacterized protein n=1 Tax=[Candida] jaroonii TaxID=467808 RepID=A0ACA9XZX0_9ASCO|nr:hypothetical protein CLIB1444_01S00540 [[Candida] jaroonii]